MSLAKDYINKLLNHENFEHIDAIQTASGANESEINQLLDIYPECSDTLLEMLSIVNGTHPAKSSAYVSVPLLGSDLEGVAYFLRSAEQIVKSSEENESLEEIYDIDSIENGDVYIDPRIDFSVPVGEWLHFADCINEGETSKLYIDFSPAEDGSIGQIIRSHYENSEYSVIADSFEEYLHIIKDDNYKFLL